MSTLNARPPFTKFTASLRTAPRFRVAAILALAAGLPAAAQTTHHVALCGDDAWTGASAVCAAPNGPKRTIQSAINAALNGDTVLVADGTYTGPGNRDIDFGGRAIAVRSAGGASVCIIDCGGNQLEPHRAFHFHSGETASSVLEGFTIQNGSMPVNLGDFGGAVFCDGSAPEIRSCTFRRNAASWGAAINAVNTNLRLVGCTFTDNEAENIGGAIHAGSVRLTAIDCTFGGNSAAGFSGGGAINMDSDTVATYTNCTFTRNSTAEVRLGGGAISCWSANGTWTNCRFIENTAGRFGGGVYVTRYSQARFTACEFTGNSGDVGGGAAVTYDSNATLVNCLFTANRNTGVERPGAALSVGNGPGGPASVRIVNCTFSGNSANGSGAAVNVAQTSNVSVSNSILWNNTPAEVLADPSATATLSFTNIQGGGWSGTGNINADPLFGWGSHPYAIGPRSPCIDAADNTAVPMGVITDLAGNGRFIDDLDTPDTGTGPAPIVDMGAYEYQGCYADCDTTTGPGTLDIFDFLCFQNRYDTNDPYACDCDISTGPGTCDIFDFLCFQNAYDAGCP